MMPSSASKKLDDILQMLEIYKKFQENGLSECKMAIQASLEHQQEYLRLQEKHLAQTEEREKAKKVVEEKDRELQKKREEQQNANKTEREQLEKSVDDIYHDASFKDCMTKKDTIHNFLSLYNLMCRLLQAMTQSQLAALSFVAKEKKNLVGTAEMKFTEAVKKLAKEISDQHKEIEKKKNSRSRLKITQLTLQDSSMNPNWQTNSRLIENSVTSYKPTLRKR